MNVWEAIGAVSSGVTLVAFIVAVAYAAYRHRIGHAERMIRSASAADRPRLVEAELKHFPVETSGLSRDQKYELVLEQIRAHGRNQTYRLWTTCFVALLSSGIAAFALYKVPFAGQTPAFKDAPAASAPVFDGASPPAKKASAPSSAPPSAPASRAASAADKPLAPQRPASPPASPKPQASPVSKEDLPSRPPRTLELAVQLFWDAGEGATPGMNLPSPFSCGSWVALPIDPQRPSHFRKQRRCTASVSKSGETRLKLTASQGQVYVTGAYQLDGYPPQRFHIGWMENDRKVVSIPIVWKLE